MAQPSVACYFNTRKRSAVEDQKVNRARKVLVLDSDSYPKINKEGLETNLVQQNEHKEMPHNEEKIVENNKLSKQNMVQLKKQIKAPKKKIFEVGKNQQDIQDLINNMKTERCVTPTPPSEVGQDGSNKVNQKNAELKNIKNKLTRSARLAELKASINRFKDGEQKLKEAEKKTAALKSESPKLKTFKTIELEIVSPQKVQSPEKAYLSPRKDTTVRKNLLNLLSPTKNAIGALPESPSKKILETTSKPALTLPFKYRYLAEMFRGIDTIVQMLYNRKETITFNKLKPAVEEMLKRNLTLRHLAQLKHIYPDAFNFQQEKLRVFGAGMKKEQWELVLIPNIEDKDRVTSDILLNRRRRLFNALLERVKTYHDEFLKSLDPPIYIPKDKVTRWHPEFDIEKVPDIEQAEIPQAPIEEKLTTGKQVLDKAREMFGCNTRMEQALERLRASKATNTEISAEKSEEKPSVIPTSLLKGIPKALLEKVRERQAAKALASMTRSDEQENEVKMYSRLPELARLTRNLFVTEKKGVLPLEMVIDKLGNCYRTHLTRIEMEEHLKLISKECPDWLVFHNIRNINYLKLNRNADLSILIHKLENLAKEKNDS